MAVSFWSVLIVPIVIVFDGMFYFGSALLGVFVFCFEWFVECLGGVV